jgi:hypothetical protein
MRGEAWNVVRDNAFWLTKTTATDSAVIIADLADPRTVQALSHLVDNDSVAVGLLMVESRSLGLSELAAKLALCEGGHRLGSHAFRSGEWQSVHNRRDIPKLVDLSGWDAIESCMENEAVARLLSHHAAAAIHVGSPAAGTVFRNR